MMHPLGRPVWTADPGLAAYGPPADGAVVDLAVVGGGILGLVIAITAARAGLRVQLLEAGAIGAGASMMNGGQIIPGLKHDPDSLIARFGPAIGARVVALAERTADAVFDLIERERLFVPRQRAGWIQAAHASSVMPRLAARVAAWQERGADVEMLDRAQVSAMTGASGYVGGWIDRRAGVIDPAAYVGALAGLAERSGAQLSSTTRAASIAQQGDGFRIDLGGGGSLRAGKIAIATNAYTDGLVPGLAQSIVPLHSFQIATAPLPADLLDGILPGGQAVSDSRRILVYFRKTPNGRLMLGGRGAMAVPTRVDAWAHLERALYRAFPQLGDIAITHRWFGRVAMTHDHLPRLHEPMPGMIAAIGCQGRGIGLMTALGEEIGTYLTSGDANALSLPLTPVRPIPLHGLRNIGVAAMIAWYRFLDGLER